MTLPGFTGEASVYPKIGHYQLSWRPRGLDGYVPAAQIVSNRTASGVRARLARQGLGFSCGGLGCVCSGDVDCNDMFSTNVCGPNATCFESGGQVICVCLR
jgi:hypothetical protein